MCHALCVMITQHVSSRNHNGGADCITFLKGSSDLHGVAVEKLLELPLSGRICEIPNIEPTTLISTGSSGVNVGVAVGVVVDGGLSQGVGEIVCGSRHV